MDNWFIYVIIGIVALYFFQPQIFTNLTSSIPFFNNNVSIVNTTTTIPESVVTTTTMVFQSVVNGSDLGRPSNNYGFFNCNYDSDCTIYLECTDCKCRVSDGMCYNSSMG